MANRLPMKINALEFNIRQVWLLVFVIGILAVFSCNTMSHFDAWSYKETISSKVEALELMDLAVDSFHWHEKESRETMLQMKKIHEYEKNRPKNFETAKMWELLLDEDKNLFGTFMKRWEEKHVHNKALLEAKKDQVEKAFNIIIDLENNKIKRSDVISFINSHN